VQKDEPVYKYFLFGR